MPEIPIIGGNSTIVSEEDYEYLIQFRWFLVEGYAKRSLNNKHSALHKEVAMRIGMKGSQIDHRDRDRLNNQRENLRPATTSQNQMNQAAHVDKTYSEFKGVTYNRQKNKWVARIMRQKVRYHLGYFDTDVQAAKAFNLAAIKYHGEFAVLNEIG